MNSLGGVDAHRHNVQRLNNARGPKKSVNLWVSWLVELKPYNVTYLTQQTEDDGIRRTRFSILRSTMEVRLYQKRLHWRFLLRLSGYPVQHPGLPAIRTTVISSRHAGGLCLADIE